MSRLNPASVMQSFTSRITAYISKWRRRKQNEVMDDHYDCLQLESLEQRMMLDGDNPGEDDFHAAEESAWFAQLPSDAALAVVDYFNSEATLSSTKIWRPIEQIHQAEPDPATGQVSQSQVDALNLNRFVGSDSRTSVDNTYWDTYSIDQNLWTGLDIAVEVKSFAQDDGSYIVVHKSTQRDRSVDVGSVGSSGGPGGPGAGEATNPFEEIDSVVTTTLVQTDEITEFD